MRGRSGNSGKRARDDEALQAVTAAIHLFPPYKVNVPPDYGFHAFCLTIPAMRFRADRPLGVTRNSYNLPARYNVDLRYSRVFPVTGRARLELMAEVKNLFNTEQWASATTTVNTDALRSRR